MEAQDEHVGSNDHTHIVIKGKRTKRQRPSSPFPAAVTSSSSSGCAGGEGGGPGRRGRVDDCYNSISSATTSGEISTEEEEDMANCLIMLAQGQVRPRGQGEEISHKVAKFDDVKVNEVVTATTAAVNKAAAGFYVYECKTCNRSFPSFQALGGHRASHKKPKPVLSPPLKNEFEEGKTNTNSASLCLPAADSHKVYQGANNNKAKIHECSICGSEFSSGQALGGHMRRHRAAAVASAAAASNHVTMSVDDTTSTNDSNTGEIKPRSILPLDLNLPAPEDDLHDTKFQFGSTQQALVFSAPALVDCHY